jgi:hypothetical protein
MVHGWMGLYVCYGSPKLSIAIYIYIYIYIYILGICPCVATDQYEEN